jgi:hypothetical protein
MDTAVVARGFDLLMTWVLVLAVPLAGYFLATRGLAMMGRGGGRSGGSDPKTEILWTLGGFILVAIAKAAASEMATAVSVPTSAPLTDALVVALLVWLA